MNVGGDAVSVLESIDQDAAEAMVDAARIGILNEIQRGRSVEEAVNLVQAREKAQFSPLGAAGESILALRLEAIQIGRQQVLDAISRVRYMQQSSLRSGREAWYAGPAEDAENWHGLRQRLQTQERTEEEIELVDEESTTVLSLIDNPGKQTFSTRGLVIGHVQSGKTGNMAALIAKAADTPFKFVLVLSGMTDSLRNQTQDRLDKDVVSTAPQGRWYSWTRVNRRVGDVLENGDFTPPAGGAFQLQGGGNHLAVVKKNAGILRRFLKTLRQTPMRDLEQTPFLIIDDECDQASVNSAPLKRAITKINELIRDIIAHLPRVTYVGYTATPFANVLIDPSVPSDLYPRHFIHALRRPSAYFGAVELFGREALEGEAEDVDSGFDMIRTVDDNELPGLRPSGRNRAGFLFEVTKSLDQAVRYFVMVIAARLHRGHDESHMTMLVHTSMLNSVHRLTCTAIGDHLAELTSRLERNDSEFLAELRCQWDKEIDSVSASEFGRESTLFDDISGRLLEAARAIEIKIENWTSTDRIDYSEPGRRYLVIGGNVLARGLTLEGLVVSFFVRSSSQYDTLMQMGRWFGYRRGFEDLPRIWMEEDVRDAFFDLATIEEEVRRDVAHYAAAQVTPEEFAVRIRKIPGLMITARNKMQSFVMAEIGYAGRHLQTIRFLREDLDWLRANWKAGADLVDSAPAAVDIRGNHVFKDVNVDDICNFLQSYQVHETNSSMRAREMLAFIQRSLDKDSSLSSWNVVVVTSRSMRPSAMPLGKIGNVSCVNRAPMRGSGKDASIKALMSKDDLLGDFESLPPESERSDWDAIKKVRERERLRPLLLLYPIHRHSTPVFRSASGGRGDGPVREDMNAVMDLLGVGIYFPGQPESSQTYVSARLDPLEPEIELSGEDAIPADLIDDAR
jgi:hypothetical protein